MGVLGFQIDERGTAAATIQIWVFDPDMPISSKYRTASKLDEAIADFRANLDFIEKEGKAELALARRRKKKRKKATPKSN